MHGLLEEVEEARGETGKLDVLSEETDYVFRRGGKRETWHAKDSSLY